MLTFINHAAVNLCTPIDFVFVEHLPAFRAGKPVALFYYLFYNGCTLFSDFGFDKVCIKADIDII
jgi:hypothetical protein